MRGGGELAPLAVLIASPSDGEVRDNRTTHTAWNGDTIHVTQTGEADAPHLMVEVIPTSATLADGDIVCAVSVTWNTSKLKFKKEPTQNRERPGSA